MQKEKGAGGQKRLRPPLYFLESLLAACNKRGKGTRKTGAIGVVSAVGFAKPTSSYFGMLNWKGVPALSTDDVTDGGVWAIRMTMLAGSHDKESEGAWTGQYINGKEALNIPNPSSSASQLALACWIGRLSANGRPPTLSRNNLNGADAKSLSNARYYKRGRPRYLIISKPSAISLIIP